MHRNKTNFFLNKLILGLGIRKFLLYPRYDVYREYIVFAFSVAMFVCLSVCKLFFVKDFSATTWVRILKFDTKLDSDELYYVTKNSHILLISPFICSFFFLSNGNFCHRFLSSYWSQCFQILCTPSGRHSVLRKWNLRCKSSFCLLFSMFLFFPSFTHGHFFCQSLLSNYLS